jgi:hypothetical protein
MKVIPDEDDHSISRDARPSTTTRHTKQQSASESEEDDKYVPFKKLILRGDTIVHDDPVLPTQRDQSSPQKVTGKFPTHNNRDQYQFVLMYEILIFARYEYDSDEFVVSDNEVEYAEEDSEQEEDTADLQEEGPVTRRTRSQTRSLSQTTPPTTPTNESGEESSDEEEPKGSALRKKRIVNPDEDTDDQDVEIVEERRAPRTRQKTTRNVTALVPAYNAYNREEE